MPVAAGVVLEACEQSRMPEKMEALEIVDGARWSALRPSLNEHLIEADAVLSL
jgi:hypothetical protein